MWPLHDADECGCEKRRRAWKSNRSGRRCAGATLLYFVCSVIPFRWPKIDESRSYRSLRRVDFGPTSNLHQWLSMTAAAVPMARPLDLVYAIKHFVCDCSFALSNLSLPPSSFPSFSRTFLHLYLFLYLSLSLPLFPSPHTPYTIQNRRYRRLPAAVPLG